MRSRNSLNSKDSLSLDCDKNCTLNAPFILPEIIIFTVDCCNILSEYDQYLNPQAS